MIHYSPEITGSITQTENDTTLGGDTLHIDNSNGRVGIQSTSPEMALDVSGSIRASADVTAYSDERVKENIETVGSALQKTNQLRGVYYNRIGEVERKIGVIAQEIEQHLPEVVHTDSEGMKSVSYGNIVGLLIEAIKELSAEIDSLKQ